MTTILIADDHPVVRLGLRKLLETEPGFSVVGEAADGQEVVDKVEEVAPDIVILDLMMPRLNGLEVMRRLKASTHATNVLILSIHTNEAYVVQALHHGASGYVVKDAAAQELATAIREVAAGRRYLSRPLSQAELDKYTRRIRDTQVPAHDALTMRERQVLLLAAEGRSGPEIATHLGISPRTVEVHRANVLRKLRLQSQTDLVRYALRHGLISMDE